MSEVDFDRETKRDLCQRVAGYCSNPDCRVSTIGPHSDPTKVTRVGQAAHIHGAREGSARYDPNLSPEEISHITNGIWLCGRCHTLVDRDEEQFPVRELRCWKEKTERHAAVELKVGTGSSVIRGSSSDGLELLGRSLLGLAQRRLGPEKQIKTEEESIQIGSEERCVEIIKRLLKELSPDELDNVPSLGIPTAKKRIRTKAERRTIGLLATSAFPLEVEVCEQLFPELDWRTNIEGLAELNLVEIGEHALLSVPDEVGARVLADHEEKRRYDNQWLEVLIPLQAHYDIAILLALKLFEFDRYFEAIEVIIYGAQLVEPGYWNTIYRDALEKLYEREFEHFSDELKARTLNGLGLCFLHDQQPSRALDCFNREKELAASTGQDWAYDEALINQGIAYSRLKAFDEAESCYVEAIERARGAGDEKFESRLLHNLAEIKMRVQPKEAMRLLEDSIKIKSGSEDRAGVLSSKLMMGLAHVEAGETQKSIDIFEKVACAANELSLDRLESLALINQASSSVHLGDLRQALALYTAAESIARKFGYPREFRFALQGRAKVHTELGDYEEAMGVFKEVLHIAIQQGHALNAIITRHDIGICARGLGRTKRARQHWWKLALRRARQERQTEWIYRCRLANALSWQDDSGQQKVLEKLRRYANEEERRDEFLVAARLWSAYVMYAEDIVKWDKLEKRVERISQLLAKDELRIEESLELRREQFTRYRQAGELEKAFEELQHAEELIGQCPSEETVRIIEEQAIILQQLGRLADAEARHHRALKMAQEIEDDEAQEISLHNLGELKRQMHQPEVALDFFRKEEENARDRGDIGAALTAANHCAITLCDIGRIDEALDLLDEIKREAKQKGADRELAVALENKATVFWRDFNELESAIELLVQGVQLSRGDVDVHVRASVSLARAYRMNGENEAALKALENVRDLASMSYGHLVALERAEIYMEMEAWLEAAEVCQDALDAALWGGDRVGRAITHLKQYHALIKAGRLEDALTAKESAYDLVATAPEEAMARAEQIQIEIAIDDLGAVEEQWDQLDALTTPDDVPGQLSEVEYGTLLSLGEYFFEKPSHRLEACKCFVKAVVNALYRYDPAQMFEPGVRWLKCLHELSCKEEAQLVEELQVDLIDWWNEQEIVGPARLTDFVMWPFQGAVQLQNVAAGENLGEEHLDDIVQGIATPSLEALLRMGKKEELSK